MILDTKGTPSASDDVVLSSYSETTSPSLPTLGWYDINFTVDSQSNKIYVGTDSGVFVIDTKGTNTQADDVLSKTYSISSSPAIRDNYVYSLLLSNSKLYTGTDFGVDVINLNNTYTDTGIYRSVPLQLNSTPNKNIMWNSSVSTGNTIKLQTRTGDENAVWNDTFDDGNPSEFAGDYYGWGEAMTSGIESSGTMKLSNPAAWCDGGNTACLSDTWVNTGKPEGFFPAGSTVRVRLRINSNTRQSERWADYLYTDDFADSAPVFKWPNNQWFELQINTTRPFSRIGIEPTWKYGTWDNANDSIEIDTISIELPDSYWGPWSNEYSNSEGSTITSDAQNKTYIQYKANLSTTDPNTTPQLNSVSFSDGFPSSGTFISNIIDGGSKKNWSTLSAAQTKPANTDIKFYSRSGDTNIPDTSWGDWSEVIQNTIGKKNRYLQIKAILSTNDLNFTPTLSSFSVISQNIAVFPTTTSVYKPTSQINVKNVSTTVQPTDIPEPTDTNETLTQTATPSSSPSPIKTLSVVRIRIVGTQGNGISGIIVTLHSTPREAITDSNGVATFTDVEEGEHTASYLYKNKNYSSTFTVSTSNSNVTNNEFTKELLAIDTALLQTKSQTRSPFLWYLAAAFILITVLLIFFLIKQRRNKNVYTKVGL